MTSKEIFERIEEVIDRKGMVKREISKNLGMGRDAVYLIIKNRSCRLYTALDIIYEVGLELQLDNKPMRCHQDLIDYINARNPVNLRISKATGISQGMIQRLKEGGNVQFVKTIEIIDALGIEVRVV